MTKQEDIRGGIADIIFNSWGKYEKTTDTAYDIVAYLHSQGVVIKVERERPENPYIDSVYDKWIIYEDAVDDMNDLVAVEPLIEEKKTTKK